MFLYTLKKLHKFSEKGMLYELEGMYLLSINNIFSNSHNIILTILHNSKTEIPI